MQVITINKQKWAAGFWWQPITMLPRKQISALNRQRAETAESTEASKTAGSELRLLEYNVFVPLKRLKQIGISSVENVKDSVHIPSLAGALARLYGWNSNILAFFEFDDGDSWLFAIKDGQILPGGDLYGEVEMVREQYRRFNQSNIWHQKIETVDTGETEEKIQECLEALTGRLPEVHPAARSFYLKEAPALIRSRPRTVISAGLIAVLIVTAGAVYYQQRVEQAHLAEQKRLERKREKIQKKLQQQKKAKSMPEIREKLFQEKWKREPDPALIVETCYDEVKREPYQIKGWRFENITCTPGKIRIARKRAAWASFTGLPPDTDLQIEKPNTAFKTKQQDFREREGRKIIGKKTISANLYELARQMGSPVELTWREPKPRKVSEKERKRNEDLPKMILSPYWIGHFHLKEIPGYYVRNMDILNRFPGLTVQKVKKNESWSIRGEVYAN